MEQRKPGAYRRDRNHDMRNDRFLAAIAAGETALNAAQSVGFTYQGMYARKRSDPAFAARWEAALAAAQTGDPVHAAAGADDTANARADATEIARLPDVDAAEAVAQLRAGLIVAALRALGAQPGGSGRPVPRMSASDLIAILRIAEREADACAVATDEAAFVEAEAELIRRIVAINRPDDASQGDRA